MEKVAAPRHVQRDAERKPEDAGKQQRDGHHLQRLTECLAEQRGEVAPVGLLRTRVGVTRQVRTTRVALWWTSRRRGHAVGTETQTTEDSGIFAGRSDRDEQPNPTSCFIGILL